MKSRIITMMILIFSLLFTGCWDKSEIERRIFISTIGVDSSKDIDKELKDYSKDKFSEKTIKKIKVTYGFPDISGFSPSKAIIEKDSTLTVDTYSMEGALIEASSKSSRSIYLGHTRLLLLSKDLFQYPDTVKEIMDYISREPKLNRKINMVVTEGNTEQFMKAQFDVDKHIQTYISGIIDNSESTSKVLGVTLNDFLVSMKERNKGLLPMLKVDRGSGELKLSGMAVIDDYEFKGELNDVETTNLELLRGNMKKGVKVICMEGHPYDYEINKVKKEIEINQNNDNISVNIYLHLDGEIKDRYSTDNKLKLEEVKLLEEALDKNIREECEKLVKNTQQNIGVDIIGIDEYMEKFKPSLWKQLKDSYKEQYLKTEVRIFVESTIRSVGITN